MVEQETSRQPHKRNRWLLPLAGVVLIALLAWLGYRYISTRPPKPQTEPYTETFDSAGTWKVGEGVTSQGLVADGVYEMWIDPELGGDIFWATAGRTFADGRYEVEATPLEGAVDNGYGMLIRVDEATNRFYVFKISSDGYIFIGLCLDNCLEETALVSEDWFGSPAVEQGFGVTNHLRVDADGSQMTFFVNDEPVGEVDDPTLAQGDIGLLAETFTPGGIRIAFDNFKVLPLESE